VLVLPAAAAASVCFLLLFLLPSSGAVTSLAWNQDGTSLVTAGEDGAIKQYSRTGNLRSKLAQCDQAVYCVTWAPDQQAVLYCTGRYLIVKPLAVSAKVVKWKAHDATVLKVDWNPISNLIVSGGEDRKYKVRALIRQSHAVRDVREYIRTGQPTAFSHRSDVFPFLVRLHCFCACCVLAGVGQFRPTYFPEQVAGVRYHFGELGPFGRVLRRGFLQRRDALRQNRMDALKVPRQ